MSTEISPICRKEIGTDSKGRYFMVYYTINCSHIMIYIRGDSNNIAVKPGEEDHYVIDLTFQEKLAKPQDHIRRFYYVLIDIIQSLKDERLRSKAIRLMLLITKKSYIQIKYTLPAHLRHLRGIEEFKGLISEIDAKRKKFNHKMRLLSSSASDEISISRDYIQNAFKLNSLLSSGQSIYGIGSCFAQNMVKAVKLKWPNSDANAYSLSDHVNTPAANLQMLRYCFEEEKRKGILDNAANGLEIKSDIDVHKLNLEMLEVRRHIENSDVVLCTFGSCLDIRMRINSGAQSQIFPRFLTGYGLQMPSSSTLAKSELTLSIDHQAQVLDDLCNVFLYLSSKTKETARVIVTVSPIPIVNSVGLKIEHCDSIHEVDAICKGKLRSSMHEALCKSPSDKVKYFPSFEIVRFLGLYHPGSVFGSHDLHADHLDLDIIKTISKCLIS